MSSPSRVAACVRKSSATDWQGLGPPAPWTASSLRSMSRRSSTGTPASKWCSALAAVMSGCGADAKVEKPGRPRHYFMEAYPLPAIRRRVPGHFGSRCWELRESLTAGNSASASYGEAVMIVGDFESSFDVNDIDALQAILMRRHERDQYGPVGSANAFWMCPGETQDYPQLGLMVKDDLAYLYYVPRDGDVGFRSVGNLPDLEPEGMTTFPIGSGEDIDVQNDAVVPFSAAVAAAKEFLVTKKRPQCMEWRRVGE